MNAEQRKCEICGEPMPEGEDMFKFHGYSGPCPKAPLPHPVKPSYEQLKAERDALAAALRRLVWQWDQDDLPDGWDAIDRNDYEEETERVIRSALAASGQGEG